MNRAHEKTNHMGAVPQEKPKTITHGCRLNGYESEAMANLAQGAGLSDVVIINSCAVTAEAVRQTRQSIRRARREAPSARLVVTGCAAQIDHASFAQMSEVDAVIGNHEKLLPATWDSISNNLHAHEDNEASEDTTLVRVNDIMAVRETAPHLIDGYGDRARAFLQIQNGCDHRCTFCIIPYGRGNSRSVPIATVVEQAKRLVDAGHRELVLTGVDITSWGPDLGPDLTLGNLVESLLDQVPDLYRLRLSSIDGAEIDERLFDRLTQDARIAPYLHLSLQSGDDMILKRMKRRHNRAQAIEFCQRARARRPEMAFGADIIAGFPTETDAMFENSRRLIDEAGLQYVHVFPYSPREGTPAARMPQLERAIIKERAASLREKGKAALHSFLDGLMGTQHTAISESGGRGRLANFASVHLDHADGPGGLIDVTITGRSGEMLTASAHKNAPSLSMVEGH